MDRYLVLIDILKVLVLTEADDDCLCLTVAVTCSLRYVYFLQKDLRVGDWE